eukprot:3001567-Prymnesium_polylepis.1
MMHPAITERSVHTGGCAAALPWVLRRTRARGVCTLKHLVGLMQRYRAIIHVNPVPCCIHTCAGADGWMARAAAAFGGAHTAVGEKALDEKESAETCAAAAEVRP